jgi:glycosyltransferase involved in cell wall biosynthesis
MDRKLLFLSYRFPPETYALAIRVKYFLNHLRRQGWYIDAITAASEAESQEGLRVHHVPSWTPERLLQALQDLYLGKLVDLFVWPDPYLFWVLPAYLRARRLVRENQYDAIVVFMMPHSTGLVGLLLRRATDCPLIFNMNDSLTCPDMNDQYPTRLHHELARRLEDRYVQAADAAIYVSKRNMERVRDRQPREHRDGFHLIRRGAKCPPAPRVERPGGEKFCISYTGGTSGWFVFLEEENPPSFPKRLYKAWEQLGTHSHADLDVRTHSPIYVGRAVKQVLNDHPEWRGRIQVDVYGKRYPETVENAVLEKFGLQDIVHLHGPVPHDEALRNMAESDLLFMALPDRVDGSPGGRISAKTYEYLRTDRPVLAALPPGENREYLRDKPGVYLTEPDGVTEMTRIISELAAAKFNGDSISVDRSELESSLSGTSRARAFESVLSKLWAD